LRERLVQAIYACTPIHSTENMTNLSGTLFASILVCFAVRADAVQVLDFHTFRAAPATTILGQDTNAPVVGSLTETANSSFVIGYLATPLSLVNVGDQISLTFDVTFNDGTGIANVGDNFRFALFDENGQTRATADNAATAGVAGQTDNFRGYIFGVRNGSGTGSTGSIRERNAMLASGANAFSTAAPNGTSAPSLGTVGGDPVTLASSVNGNGAGPLYSGTMVLTLTAGGIDLSGSFIGSNSLTGNVFAASDTTGPFSTTYGAVGFLIGNGLSVDQVSFSNINVNLVPEPASAALLGVGSLVFLGRRRRG